MILCYSDLKILGEMNQPTIHKTGLVYNNICALFANVEKSVL